MKKLPKLSRSEDFATVRRRGTSWADRDIVLIASPRVDGNIEISSRCGFVVSRRVGNAVLRNRCKRRMRESAKSFNISDGHDIVFIARENLSRATFGRIQDSMSALLLSAGLVVEKDIHEEN